MSFLPIFSRRFAVVAGAIFAVAVIAGLFAYEPVTRNLVAAEAVCTYCHLQQEYVPTARLSFSSSHPAEPKQGEPAAREHNRTGKA